MSYDERGRERGRDGSEDRRDREAREARRRARREQRRKERVLHTRISEELEEDLRRAAEELRVPVSNLVRNVLEEAVTVVEAVSEDFGELIEDVVGSAEEVADRFKRRYGHERGRWTEAARAARARAAERAEAAAERAERGAEAAEPARPAPRSGKVLGWQPLVLAEEQRCECGRTLPAGRPAHVALTTDGLTERYRCDACIAGLGGGASG